MATHLRSRARSVWLLAIAVMAVGLALLQPASSLARSARSRRVAHVRLSRVSCARRHHAQRVSHRRASRHCEKLRRAGARPLSRAAHSFLSDAAPAPSTHTTSVAAEPASSTATREETGEEAGEEAAEGSDDETAASGGGPAEYGAGAINELEEFSPQALLEEPGADSAGESAALAPGDGSGGSSPSAQSADGSSAEPAAGNSGGEQSPDELPLPQSAQAEDFAAQPSDVLLTYAEAVTPSDASRCLGVNSSGSTEPFAAIDQGPTAETLRLTLIADRAMPVKVRCTAGTNVGDSTTAASSTLTGASGAQTQTQTLQQVSTVPVAAAAASSGGVVSDPIDPNFLAQVPFGRTSFWIQPWRAYLDTWPASRLLESVGINFNVGPANAEATAQLLHDSGFRLARREIPWGSLSYNDPTSFANGGSTIRTVLTALQRHGLRPLILLNANSGDPGPSRAVTLKTLSRASAGARTVKLASGSASAVVPGLTGFNHLSFGGDPDILIDSVSRTGVATLSRPLPSALAAGEHRGTTLRYAPFAAPTLAGGAPNPAFRATLHGWLNYVSTVAREAESIFGPGGYDLEIWNELGFGSQFLNAEHYDSPTGGGDPEVNREIRRALLDETIAFVRNPSNHFSASVGITNGFASQSPFPSGAAPIGLTALSKHLYGNLHRFPSEFNYDGGQPTDALGRRDTASSASTKPLFLPHYQSDLPEYFLTATSTETIVRDLAPFTTRIYGSPHGREVGPPGGAPVQKWMTEYNLASKGPVVGPDEVTTQSSVTLTSADKAHFEAKALLRSLVAMVSKGMTREYFFAAAPGPLGLIDEAFFSAEQAHPGSYPGDQLGGETMSGFRNLLGQFQGPGPSEAARQLKLLSIAQEGNHAQFSGDGTAAHPSLYDRDVLAVFPFQSSPRRFVIPVYVMTRDLLTLYHPNAPSADTSRFDLPDETFRITLGNLPETTQPPSVHAYDPLRNQSTTAQLISRQGHTAVFQIAATDYPRVMTLEYPSGR
jgi:hypothetical protein